MSKRMLVDASHAEEIRVAIVQDQKLIDLEIESSTKEQIKGNIYLGRVTRVEPSLQAAFVDFNGGRQGFLSLDDIHVKYYPVEKSAAPARPARRSRAKPAAALNVADAIPPPADEETLPLPEEILDHTSEEDAAPDLPFPEEEPGSEEFSHPQDDEEDAAGESMPDIDEAVPAPATAADEGDDDLEGRFFAARQHRRRLPIQKILTRGQTLLVQVVKESRGGKGASLTTNISLAGRYTVLLPENSGGGGISRKIVDTLERKELKEILATLEIPPEMSLIIRTAGLSRNKREISRDMSYLLRLWKKIQDGVEKSNAPALIHEEGDLVIRTIRDLYTTDMEEILIEGSEAYRRGKDFMRLLMPSYVKVVQPYKDKTPLFARHQVEHQIESMHDRTIRLKSGGYLVVDITEALVTVDINSGRATREKNVESTAFKTNLEAADEIARQLRLRDLGGLLVIDFIDMEDKKHNLEVEKRLKDAFKMDRAKIQMGRISQFGLLELSRQRLKPAFSESNRQVCPRCHGLGTVRSVESAAIHVFRCLEEDAGSGKYRQVTYRTPPEVADYLQNQKRSQIMAMEQENEVTLHIVSDATLMTPDFLRERAGKDGGAVVKDGSREQGSHGSHGPQGQAPGKEVGSSPPRQESPGGRGPRGPRPAPVPASASSSGGEAGAAPKGEAVVVAAPVVLGEDGQPVARKRRRRRRRRGGGGVGEGGVPVAPQWGVGGIPPDEGEVEEVPGALATEVPGLYVLTPAAPVGDGAAVPVAAGGRSVGRRPARSRPAPVVVSPVEDGGEDEEEDGPNGNVALAGEGEGEAGVGGVPAVRRRRRRRRRRPAGAVGGGESGGGDAGGEPPATGGGEGGDES